MAFPYPDRVWQVMNGHVEDRWLSVSQPISQGTFVFGVSPSGSGSGWMLTKCIRCWHRWHRRDGRELGVESDKPWKLIIIGPGKYAKMRNAKCKMQMRDANLLAISKINHQVSNWRAAASSKIRKSEKITGSEAKMGNRVINFSANMSHCRGFIYFSPVFFFLASEIRWQVGQTGGKSV